MNHWFPLTKRIALIFSVWGFVWENMWFGSAFEPLTVTDWRNFTDYCQSLKSVVILENLWFGSAFESLAVTDWRDFTDWFKNMKGGIIEFHWNWVRSNQASAGSDQKTEGEGSPVCWISGWLSDETRLSSCQSWRYFRCSELLAAPCVSIQPLARLHGGDHYAQTINYLDAHKVVEISLLFNFGEKSLKWKRFIKSKWAVFEPQIAADWKDFTDWV